MPGSFNTLISYTLLWENISVKYANCINNIFPSHLHYSVRSRFFIFSCETFTYIINNCLWSAVICAPTQPLFTCSKSAIDRPEQCQIYSKLTAMTLEQPYWDRSGVVIVNFEQILQLVLVFLMLTLNRF